MHSKEDIVTSNDLSIDFAFCEGSNGVLGIVFEQIYESNNTNNVDIFQKVLSLCFEESGDFSLGNLLAAETNTSVALQRHFLDEVLIFVDFDLRIIVDHFRASLRSYVIFFAFSILVKYRH